MERCPVCNGNGNIFQFCSGHKVPEECPTCEGTGELMPHKFTCCNCPSEPNCVLAWSAYNTDGDCLANK